MAASDLAHACVRGLLESNGEREQACRMGLEGIVAKRNDAPYRSGRQDSWVKLKCVKSDTFPIIAFVN